MPDWFLGLEKGQLTIPFAFDGVIGVGNAVVLQLTDAFEVVSVGEPSTTRKGDDVAESCALATVCFKQPLDRSLLSNVQVRLTNDQIVGRQDRRRYFVDFFV